jgi:CubicO group peptidase (beta-lactamase class C family)
MYGVGVLTATAPAAVSLNAFGLAPADVLPQLRGQPHDVGIIVATLDAGNTHVTSAGAAHDGDSVVEIGSITKTFTATLFADMILKHEVSPDDPIGTYLPSGASAPAFHGRSITLADLATQSSGLPRLPTNLAPATPSDPYADYGDDALLAFLHTYALTRAPGDTYEYSNLGFGLLGYLLARRLGVDYPSAIRARILEPLGMTHTRVAATGTTIATLPGHDADGFTAAPWHFAALAGCGAIVSTPNDMLRYMRANLDTTHGPLAAAMALAQHPTRAAERGQRIGYAWMTDPGGIVWHNGGTYGFRSFLGLDSVHQRATFVVANAYLDAVDGLGLHALNDARPLPSAPTPDVAVDPATLAGYAGRYVFADGSTGTVSVDQAGLVLAVGESSGQRFRLHATSTTTFALRHVPLTASFSGDPGTETLTLTQVGQPPAVGKRIP